MSTDTSKLNPELTAVAPEILTFFKTPLTAAPTSKAIDFDAIFGGNLSEDARTLLKAATAQRKKLLEVLSDPKADSRNVIGSVDAYLPSIWRITACMQASAESAVKLNRKLEFKWTSALNKKGKEFTGNVFLFETAFILTVRAIYHRDAAKIILEQGTDNYQDMGKELRTAAGIFEFVAKDLLARWQSPPEHRAPEVQALVHHCLANLFLADAQRLAIAKALTSSTSPTVIAKLLVGAAERYEFATRNIQAVDRETFDSLVPGLLEELGAYPAILRACAANCLAQVHWAKLEYSKGYGFAADAAYRLKVITMGKGLQNSPLQAMLHRAIERAVALEDEYRNDCEKVYFEHPSKDLRMVDGQFIINRIPYELPSADLVSFAEIPLPSSQVKMAIQSFWTSLWAKPDSYPKSNEEHVAAAASMSGASNLPGVQGVLQPPTAPSGEAVQVPEGMDPSVFSALPEAIQRELATEAERNKTASGSISF